MKVIASFILLGTLREKQAVRDTVGPLHTGELINHSYCSHELQQHRY